MAETTYEIPEELLHEMKAVCDLATEAWGKLPSPKGDGF